MIESEISLIMRCDDCGGVLSNDSGRVVRVDYDRFAYAALRQKAINSGWKCEDSCLCPVCRKDNAE